MSAVKFAPACSLSRSAAKALAAIERDARAIASAVLLPRHEQWFRREVTVERAGATTRIEGIGETPPADAAERRQVDTANANAVRAYEFIDYLSDLEDQPLDELAIRQINREFLRGESDALTPGVYRKGQNLVGSYRPPDQGDVPGLMRAFAQWLRETPDHPVVVAGVAHLHFVAVHPFWDGNGRTARGLEALVLQRSEFHCRKLLSMERRLLGVRAQYFAAIERTLGAIYGPYDATRWIEFYLTTLAEEVRGLITQLDEWHRRAAAIEIIARESGLHARQAEALLYVSKAGRISRADYIDVTAVSPMTASRDLKSLVQRGLLLAEGRTATTTYQLSPTLRDRM
jgi:Fic family protein